MMEGHVGSMVIHVNGGEIFFLVLDWNKKDQMKIRLKAYKNIKNGQQVVPHFHYLWNVITSM